MLSVEPPEENPEHVVTAMTRALVHRGPDGDGMFVDWGGRIALGHRRLAIVDLAESGKQPMVSASGRYITTFNGEIYNFPNLRHELQQLKYRFRGTGDTEVMLAAFDAWGVQRSLERLNGMFAFAVWDRREALLFMARDRLGEKPLYYWSDDRRMVFASEMKALMQCSRVPCSVDRDSLCSYLRFSYIPAPRTVFTGVHKLEPGVLMQAKIANGAIHVTQARYWAATTLFAASAAERRSEVSWDRSVDAVETLVDDAVRLRMTADVPLGAFLSGGIDSSIVVASMQRNSGRPVRTFTIGFAEFGFNEAPFAAAIARHLGTEHTEVQLSAADALSYVPSLPQVYDEPFGDSSQIPTLLVSRVARQSVTVALAGDGGDEIFGGYGRYSWWRDIWKLSRALPPVGRAALSTMLRSAGAVYAMGLPFAQVLMGERLAGWGDLPEKMQRLADVLIQRSLAGVFLRLISQATRPAEFVLRGQEPPVTVSTWSYAHEEDAFTEEMMLLDLLSYLPDDILVKVDRASMACSLETRAPLLDPRVVELSWRLPLSMKVRNRTGKQILRAVLHRHVPQELFERPKRGFGVPIAQWLRGPLRGWAENLLDPVMLSDQGLLNADPVRRCWSALLSGRRLQAHRMWNILMLQAWLDHWKSRIRL